ncbi:hypothetical protein HK405_004028, partial [Cladochytrium tenue]
TGGTAVVVLVATITVPLVAAAKLFIYQGVMSDELWVLEQRAAAASAALAQFGVLVCVLTALWIVARGLLLVFLVVVQAAVDAFVQSVRPEAMRLRVGIGECCVADEEDYTGGGIGGGHDGDENATTATTTIAGGGALGNAGGPEKSDSTVSRQLRSRMINDRCGAESHARLGTSGSNITKG